MGRALFCPSFSTREKICEKLFSHMVNYLHIHIHQRPSGVGISLIMAPGEDVFLSVRVWPFFSCGHVTY